VCRRDHPARVFQERTERTRHTVDYFGALTFALGAVSLVAFAPVERKAAEPILPLWVFSRRILLTTTLISTGCGAVLIWLSPTLLGPGGLMVFSQNPSIVVAAAGCIITGLGMGLAVTPSLIAAQLSVLWNERGVATGTNLFGRSIGSAVGVAIFGAIGNGMDAYFPVVNVTHRP